MSRTSRYNETHQHKVPKKKRTIRLRGSGEDDGKWFRCWYCGFINNIDRNAIGAGEGLTYSIASNDSNFTSDLNDEIGTTGRVVLVGNDNSTQTIVPDVVSGCSFCGSRNWR